MRIYRITLDGVVQLVPEAFPYLRSISDIHDNVMLVIQRFEHDDNNSVIVTILKHQIQWLGHVLQMFSRRTLHSALFIDK